MAKRKDIETDIFDEQTMTVVSGLTAEDKLITSWSANLRDGAVISAQEVQEPSRIHGPYCFGIGGVWPDFRVKFPVGIDAGYGTAHASCLHDLSGGGPGECGGAGYQTDRVRRCGAERCYDLYLSIVGKHVHGDVPV